VNLVLFGTDEVGRTLPASDARARHLLGVLRRGIGEDFDAGLINGARGKGRIEAITHDGLAWTFVAQTAPEAADPLHLLIGLPRPQTARDILRDATTLGVAALHFVITEKTESSYASSTLWRDREWERHLHAGAAQAFSTQIPVVTFDRSLSDALRELPASSTRVALDNYEASTALGACAAARARPLALAFGPERGWTARDRAELRAAGFELVHLGPRVLRLETAVVAALTLAKNTRDAR
jgi:RsmE family RNA methyltransferase